MNTKLAIISSLLCLFTVSCSNNKREAYLPCPLSGTWEMRNDSMLMIEKWEKGQSGSMQGLGLGIAGKDTVFREQLSIQRIGGHWVYIAQVNDNKPVLFTLKGEPDKNRLVFENEEHDYPQRVGYTFHNDDSLSAYIEGSYRGENLKEGFTYNRVN